MYNTTKIYTKHEISTITNLDPSMSTTTLSTLAAPSCCITLTVCLSLDITLQPPFTTMSPSKPKTDYNSKEQKDTQSAGSKLVMIRNSMSVANTLYSPKIQTHTVGDCKECNDCKSPGRGEGDRVTKVEESGGDTAKDDAEFELCGRVSWRWWGRGKRWLTQDRNVRSAAKKTFGSTRTGTWIFLPLGALYLFSRIWSEFLGRLPTVAPPLASADAEVEIAEGIERRSVLAILSPTLSA
jgi:hypothetical protein